MLLLFCFVIVDPIFCDRPFILWAFFCLMTLAHIVGADVTETNKWPCLTIMLFTGDHSLGTSKTQTLFKDTNIILFLQSHLQVDSLILWFDLRDRTFFLHLLRSFQSIYYQSAQHVLACPGFWAILWWIFLQKCNKYKNCAHPPFNPE